MKPELYERYLDHRRSGRRHDATDAIKDFVASFAGNAERAPWVRRFLEQGELGHRIRHEIYAGIVFPVLIEGYERKDYWCTYWLGRTAHNLYAASALHAQVRYKSERQLLREAHAIQPGDAVRRELVEAYIAEFQHCQHEWPAGILWGMDGATAEECEELLEDVAFVRALDDGAHGSFLTEFADRVTAYRSRLGAEQ